MFIPLSAKECLLSGGSVWDAGKHIGYYEDTRGVLSFDDVKKLPFAPLNRPVPNFGFTSSVYWFKTKLRPEDKALEHQWWLRVSYALLDHIDVYIQNSEGVLIKHSRSGEKEPLQNRELMQRNFLFHIPLETTQEISVFVRVKTDSAMQVPMALLTSEELIETQEAPLLWMGLYYGIFIIIVFYNAALYFQVKEQNYLVYLLFVCSFIMWQLSLDGIGVEYFWPDTAWMIEHGTVFWIAMASLFALLFGRSFLHTKEHLPFIDKTLKAVIAFAAITAVAAVFMPYKYVVPIDAALAVIAPFLLLVSGLMMMKKSYRPVKFFIASWSVFLIGSIIFALNKFNIIPGYMVIKNAQQIGSALEMILLSWALTDRVRLYQQEYVGKLNALNVTLKEKVEEGLNEAHEKEKMLLQQSRLAAMGEMIEQIAHQWRQPLNTLALINNDLYFKMGLGQFDEKVFEAAHGRINDNLQYMSKTIDDFRNYYQSNREEEKFALEELIQTAFTLNEATMKYAKISCILESEKTHYVTAIKNELLQVFMNLLKNAHDAIVERKIANAFAKVTVTDDENHLYIEVEDNGGGIDEAIISRIFDPYYTTKKGEKGTGIGLYMSKTIIEERLNGDLRVENANEGARFVITLPHV